jgi:hypothetical protein
MTSHLRLFETLHSLVLVTNSSVLMKQTEILPLVKMEIPLTKKKSMDHSKKKLALPLKKKNNNNNSPKNKGKMKTQTKQN